MTAEIQIRPMRGASVVVQAFVGLAACIAAIVYAGTRLNHVPPQDQPMYGWMIGGGALGIGLLALYAAGLTIVAPNTARVVVLFGTYRGTIKEQGFWWVNPFSKRTAISLRTRNKVTPTIKVNDIRGNPIEIGAVVVWRVVEASRASFDVDSYSSFVDTQAESALRHLASTFPYDTGHGGGDKDVSLRGSTDEVSKSLMAELQDRVAKAGVIIEEARLSHLAYAAEIAGAMLRRQQADAVVAARFRIVEGAVGMVESALEHLEKGGKVRLDEERKAAMVSNLMVVLCGDHGVQPIVNAGTLYQG